MSEANGWTLAFHPLLCAQLQKLDQQTEGEDLSAPNSPPGKVLAALSKLIYERIPSAPGAQEFRQGKTLGAEFKHWRRAKFGGRYRLFFRYDSTRRIIAYAWVNDEKTLRKAGARSDPYAVFRGMLNSGDPPDDFKALEARCRSGWTEVP